VQPTPTQDHLQREDGDVKIPIDELRFLEREKGIALETVISALESALAAAYKRQPNAPEGARVVVDRDTGDVTVFAQELDDEEQVIREWEDTPSDFGRIAAVTAKQVIMQRLREAERDVTFGEYEGRVGATSRSTWARSRPTCPIPSRCRASTTSTTTGSRST
jgi:NusA N-terminal domain